ncbi:MAG: ROK family protein [Chloroflexi bacterium]|nr:ROK family protein [Chloroflexota bacterium]
MRFELVKPQFVPPLDEGFRPAVLANRAFQAKVAVMPGGGVPLVLGLERADGIISRFQTRVLPDDHPDATANLPYVERLVKFLLWQRGAWKVYVGGSSVVADHLAEVYSADGARRFDYHFMGEQVYQHPFTVVGCAADKVPAANEVEKRQALGRHLDGQRIGFDLGASDLKISAVVDGEPIFSDEIVWEPVQQQDPDYHYQRITAALKLAASKLDRVDAIGGSSAGVYVDNRPMVASLFRGIPSERYDEVRNMFLRIRDELGLPLEVINDGDVTALAGSMSLEDNGVLGIAMGSSEAVGYVALDGNITGWLNELAFAPIDYQDNGAVDEWSGDKGVGAMYFSQQAVFRLAPKVGIELPDGETNATKLKYVQRYLEDGHPGARQIWETMGCYLGYALAHYADFYDLRHVLILGRCTSGQGGPIMLETAQHVLQGEFPALAAAINLQLPDEKSRRVGQSIAAASLPRL